MPDQHFPIFGPSIPKMVGRGEILRQLWRDLTKPTPDHISVVGPRYSGKSVLFKALEEHLKKEGSKYKAIIYWDLAHQTPATDKAFLLTLCRVIGEGIKEYSPFYSETLLSLSEDESDQLQEVLDEINDDGDRILMLWDGFDMPLRSGKLSRNLWDQLRALADNESLRLIAATRKTLHDLIRSEAVEASPFWNVFNTTSAGLEPFDEADKDSILALLPNISLETGAKTELDNWSGGFPPLYLSILNQIVEMYPNKTVSNANVNEAAIRAIDGVEGILHDLWNDCTESAKDCYRLLVEHGERPVDDIRKSDLKCLKEKGLVKLTGKKIAASCRMMEHHFKSEWQDTSSIVRLFADEADYRKNIRGFLEQRLGQLSKADDRIRRYIQRCIEDLPDHPDVCLGNMRGISDRAFDLIWEAELGKEREIPKEWFSEWKFIGEKGSEAFWNEKFPPDRSHQLRLLQLITGSTRKADPKAKHVSKATYSLADAIFRFGNFGAHLDGTDLDPGVAVAAVMICLELTACLSRELP